MRTKLEWLTTVAMCLGLLAGCKNDCEAVCESSKDCPHAAETRQDLSCADLCDAEEMLADIKDCRDQWLAFYSCGAASDDICNGVSLAGCVAEADAYSDCLSR